MTINPDQILQECEKACSELRAVLEAKAEVNRLKIAIMGEDQKALRLEIVRHCGDVFRVHPARFFHSGRTGDLALARQVAMFFMMNDGHARSSYEDVGEFFGLAHHTVAYAIKTVKSRCDTDKEIAEQVAEVERRIKATVSPPSPRI